MNIAALTSRTLQQFRLSPSNDRHAEKAPADSPTTPSFGDDTFSQGAVLAADPALSSDFMLGLLKSAANVEPGPSVLVGMSQGVDTTPWVLLGTQKAAGQKCYDGYLLKD